MARLRRHPGLEHLLHHPGHGHLEAEVVRGSSRTSLGGAGAEGRMPSGDAQKTRTHLGLLSVEAAGRRRRSHVVHQSLFPPDDVSRSDSLRSSCSSCWDLFHCGWNFKMLHKHNMNTFWQLFEMCPPPNGPSSNSGSLVIFCFCLSSVESPREILL